MAVSVVVSDSDVPGRSARLFRLAILTRFSGRQVRLAVHTSSCPVVPEDGRSVQSSGVWQVAEASQGAAAYLIQDARRRGLRVLDSCLRCGGRPADADESAIVQQV